MYLPALVSFFNSGFQLGRLIIVVHLLGYDYVEGNEEALDNCGLIGFISFDIMKPHLH